MKDSKKDFAARLSEFRAGAEKDSFWRGYDLNAGKMGRYENRKGFPSLEKLVEICEKTRLSPNWLVMGLPPVSLDQAQELIRQSASQQLKELDDATPIIKRHRTSEVSKDIDARSVHKTAQRGKKHISPGQTESHPGRKTGQE